MRIWYYAESCTLAGRRAYPEDEDYAESNADLRWFDGTDDEIRAEARRLESVPGRGLYYLRVARTLREAVPADDSPGITGSPDCPICAGSGHAESGGIDCDDDPCANCGGTGRVK